jgi:hypothetical protein
MHVANVIAASKRFVRLSYAMYILFGDTYKISATVSNLAITARGETLVRSASMTKASSLSKCLLKINIARLTVFPEMVE